MAYREELAKMLLEKHGFITNRMLQEYGQTHAGRNGIYVHREYFREKGYEISPCRLAKNFLDNRWDLIPIKPIEVPTGVDPKGQRYWEGFGAQGAAT
jgi:hypothetical protein